MSKFEKNNINIQKNNNDLEYLNKIENDIIQYKDLIDFIQETLNKQNEIENQLNTTSHKIYAIEQTLQDLKQIATKTIELELTLKSFKNNNSLSELDKKELEESYREVIKLKEKIFNIENTVKQLQDDLKDYSKEVMHSSIQLKNKIEKYKEDLQNVKNLDKIYTTFNFVNETIFNVKQELLNKVNELTQRIILNETRLEKLEKEIEQSNQLRIESKKQMFKLIGTLAGSGGQIYLIIQAILSHIFK